MKVSRASFALALAAAGALLAVLLLMEHHGESLGAVQAVCGEGSQSGCQTVARSAYSSVAGIPLAALGLLFYLSMASLLALALLGDASSLEAAAEFSAYFLILALAIDLVLLGIQAFAIRAYCRLCLLTYAVNAALLFALWPALRSKLSIRSLFSGAGRLLGGGWVSTSVATAAAVLALNWALSHREAERAANLLGQPAQEGSALEQAQAEARRLKGILDDPQKREQYVTDKSVKDFEDATPRSFDMGLPPFSGPPSAPIKVVEFSDYLCPFCRGLANGFKDYLPKSGGRVSIHYKNYPLDKACNTKLQATVHEGACWLALGAICAQQLGRFPAYQEKAYSTPEKPITREDVIRLGVDVGLAGEAMGACIDKPATKDRLLGEIDEAERSGVKATPTLFIDGKLLPRLNEFLIAVDREAARLGLPAQAPPPRR